MASSNKTDRLGLNLWDELDKPKREDFCKDNEIIEEALSGHLENMGIHVTKQLMETINNDIESATEGVKDNAAAITAHGENEDIHITSEQAAMIGAPLMGIRTYTGTGANTRSITFSQPIRFAILFAAGKPSAVYGTGELGSTGTTGTQHYFGFASETGCSQGITWDSSKKITITNWPNPTNKAYAYFNLLDTSYTVIYFL